MFKYIFLLCLIDQIASYDETAFKYYKELIEEEQEKAKNYVLPTDNSEFIGDALLSSPTGTYP